MGEGSWVGPRPLQPQKTGVSFFLFNKSSSGDNDRGERRIFEPHFHKSVSTRALSHAAPPPETRATPLSDPTSNLALRTVITLVTRHCQLLLTAGDARPPITCDR